MNTTVSTLRHIIINLSKDKESTLKSKGEATYHKQVVDNIMCQFLSKNDGGQKAVGWHS